MKGFYWGTGVVRCSFCGGRHHNITTCKVVDNYANLALEKIAKMPDYICSPHEHYALMELKNREERKAKSKKPKRAPRCSYCGSHGHKRPKCDSLKQFRQAVYKANKNWKTLFSKRVNDLGLGPGSLIKIDQNTARTLDFNVSENNIAMITKYNLANLDVFCSLGDYIRKYQSNASLEILSAGKSDTISVKYLGHLLGEQLLNTGWWYNGGMPKILSPMPWEPDQEWINSEWDEVYEWFFKDIKKSEIESSGLTQFIEDWAEKE